MGPARRAELGAVASAEPFCSQDGLVLRCWSCCLQAGQPEGRPPSLDPRLAMGQHLGTEGEEREERREGVPSLAWGHKLATGNCFLQKAAGSSLQSSPGSQVSHILANA